MCVCVWMQVLMRVFVNYLALTSLFPYTQRKRYPVTFPGCCETFVCVCVRLTVAVMLLLSSMIAAEYLLEGIAVAVDWSSVCPDSFSNLDETHTRKQSENKTEHQRFPQVENLLVLVGGTAFVMFMFTIYYISQEGGVRTPPSCHNICP